MRKKIRKVRKQRRKGQNAWAIYTSILTEKINGQYEELDFKTQAKENLVLFAISKIDIKYRKIKDELYLRKY